MPESTSRGILKKKGLLLAEAEKGGKIKSRKNIREGRHAELEAALHLWVVEKNSQGALPSNALLAAKALTLAKFYNIENFSAGESWIRRFKLRNNIAWKKAHGEKQSADIQAANDWILEKLPDLIKNYSEDNVYNADETGLYWRGLPDRGYFATSNNNNQPSGAKVPKERITALVCANMSGTEKLPILAIGKFNKPRCFPRDQSRLPVIYRHSKNSWMTGYIFTQWLQNWDRSLRAKGRKILLILDNCTAHPPNVELTNIEMVFLPPNTTSLIQPMDQGIIKNLKGHYRAKLSSRLISELDNDSSRQMKDVVKTVNLLDALYLVSEAWSDVKKETVANCFRHSRFIKNDEINEDLDIFGDIDLPDNMSRDDLVAQVDVDKDLQTSGTYTDEELVDEAKRRRQQTEVVESDDDDLEEDLQCADVVAALKLVRKFAQKNNLGNDVASLRNIERELFVQKAKPKLIHFLIIHSHTCKYS